MDGRTTLLTGLLAFILIGGGFLTLVIDNIEQEENKDDDSDSLEEQSDTTLIVNEIPSILFNDYSKSWDGENITLSGFVTDESPITSIVTMEVLDSNLITIIEPFNISVLSDGSWSTELSVSTPGEWFVKSFVSDASGQTSNLTVNEMEIIAPQENTVVITFLWDEPDENSSIGALSGVLIHRFSETCSVEYRPKYQSPTLDVIGVMDNSTGSYFMEMDTDVVNANGTIFATCGLFSVSSSMIDVILPVPPEPAGDADLDGILDDEDQCDSTPPGEPVYDTGCSDSETDDDLDSVMNSNDQCPNTPQGETVDFTGCSLSQKDADGDGVSDAVDTCPGTPAGEIVDSVGCSDSQKDTDGDGVTDDLDQCPNTPAGEMVNEVGCSTVVTNPTSMKILALHGGGDSASGLASQQGMQDLVDALPEFEIIFASTPESGNVWYQDPPGGKGEPTTDPDWADLSISYLDQMVIDNGPFYALIGYSQGSAMIPVYLANTQNTFDRVMLYNGYLPTTHHGLMDTIDNAAPFSTPAMIFSGENDGAFKDLAPALAQKFTGSLDLHSQTAGHHLPYESDQHFDQIITFIREGIEPYDPTDSWYCQDGNGPWVKDDNGDGNNYNANNRGDGQEGGGGGSGPWFQCAVSVSVSSNTMNVNSNGIPNHDWMSTFGPGDVQSHTWSITLNPTNDTNGGHNSANCPASNGRWECAPDRGNVAIAANGVPIFGPEEGPGGDAVALDFFYFDEDRQPIDLGYCGAHSGPTGVHYHWDAMCQYWEPEAGQTMKDYDWTLIDSTQHSPIIGWSFDGYPIYGMYTWDDNGVVKGMKSSYQVERTNDGGDQGYNGIDDWNYVAGLGDLDECNGRFGSTPEYPQGTYYYVSTPLSGSTTTVVDTNGDTVPMIGFPYFQLCYHGIADTNSNGGGGQGGGGGGGGGQGGFAAQTIYTHMPELLEDDYDSSDLIGLFWDVTWIWLAIVGLTLIKRKKS